MRKLMEDWDGCAVVCRFDRPTGAWIFVALHDDTMGTPTGGTRMKLYDRPEDGLRDAMRLAEGMTHKWASIGLGFGGGKAVLGLSRDLDGEARRGLLERYGRLLNTLHGGFATGEDLGTSPEDMLVVSRVSRHVHGCDPERGTARDPGPFTALGVYSGIRACLRQVFGTADLRGRRVLIEGVGHVGRPLARLCARAGAHVMPYDLDDALARQVASEIGGEAVPAAEGPSTPCDVFAPCAVGATLDRQTIAGLDCRIAAGSANNQLAEPEDADRLHEREILYAPDYVINAGGALAFGLIGLGETDEREIHRRVEGLGDALAEIFVEAAERGESPVHAARRRVERTLAEAAARAGS
jgi:leucine dehydrogenase